ncbi:MAG: glycosyltransferase [Bryobacterales bacterium]|nr:glycosyltransferase [Bryobacterales bacterium]
MLPQKPYYLIKPLLPWRFRLAFRRWHASSRRAAYAHLWPIDESTGAAPPNWPGWPAGKRFALILTHDVERTKGLQRVERLKDLERKHGFRSSFNFVPEGEYRVPDAMRQALEQAGFEVGVHGLKHDGRLYWSKRTFHARAVRIREYIRRWGASGFRSPLMQHNLAWLHELGAEYDGSTFDADPFEPEPDGVRTIFPFWVAGPHGSGYVELPYTLVQDFTLFVVLREQNIAIWKRKLDWIAEHGGMALLNTHPDYMCFDGGKPARDEYPVSHYEELLTYVREKYEGAFWSGTPREAAQFYRASLPLSSRNSRKKICMVTHSTYESDNRVRRYAEALAKRGDHVDVIAISHGDVPLGTEVLQGVTVHRIQHRERNERDKWMFARRLTRFVVASSLFLTRRHDDIRYDVIHVHNIPDFLVFAAWFPKWTGAKVILDIHDIVPEFFASKFRSKRGDLYVRLLKLVEKASAAFADHVIISNHLWQEKLTSRSVAKEKCSVFLNHVDLATFYRRPRTRRDGKFIILFPGSCQWHQGLDIAIDAFALIKDKVPGAEFHIYGGGSAKADLILQVARLGLTEHVKFFTMLPLEQIADVIANADLGVVPKRAEGFGNEAYSTKIMEFLSQGIPVVCSRTKIDTFYFDETVVRFFTSGDSRAMADAMLDVIEYTAVREAMVAAGHEYVNLHSWDVRKADYLELVDSLSTETFGKSTLATTATVQAGD